MLTLWNELATNFPVARAEQMEQPVVIAASSCWAKRHAGEHLFIQRAKPYKRLLTTVNMYVRKTRSDTAVFDPRNKHLPQPRGANC